MNQANLEQRVEELETKVMFQDDLIEQLNDSIVRQLEDIKKLTKMIDNLNSQMEDIAQPNVIDANLETPPPHY
ncbi:SlyX family protein [Aliikangiella sp. IMCC44653]